VISVIVELSSAEDLEGVKYFFMPLFEIAEDDRRTKF
jgi:hypothetical protein